MSKFNLEAVFTGVDKMTPIMLRITGGMGGMERKARSTAASISRSFARAGAGMSSFGSGLALRFAGVVTTVGFGVKRIMDSFSLFENAEANFSVLLNSVDKAKAGVNDLAMMAARTPFTFKQLSDQMKILLATPGATFEDAMGTLGQLGDLAMGDANALESITRGYVKAMNVGKADAESMRMIAERGVPIFEALRKQLNLKDIATVYSAMRKGQVTVEDMQGAITSLTTENGKFFKASETRAKTFAGRMAAFLDLIDLNLAKVGSLLNTELAPLLEDAISFLTLNLLTFDSKKDKYAEELKKFMDVLKKVGSFLFNNWEAILKSIVAYMALASAFSLLADAIAVVSGLKGALMFLYANPIVLGILALSAAVVFFITVWDDLHDILGDFATPLKLIIYMLMLLMGPIGAVAALALLIGTNFDVVKSTLLEIPNILKSAWDWITGHMHIGMMKVEHYIDTLKTRISDLAQFGKDFGFNFMNPGDTLGRVASGAVGMSPEASMSKMSMNAGSSIIQRSITEATQTSRAVVTIKDESGKAKIDENKLDSNVSLQMSGSYR